MNLYPWQEAAVAHAEEWLCDASRGAKRLYSAPTGTGKSYVQCELKRRTGATLVAPTPDILRGFAQKLGCDGSRDAMERGGFYTPLRLRNVLLKGDVPPPRLLIIDESHHVNAETYELIDALADAPPMVGFSATCFRGSMNETAKLRATWGEPVPIITMTEAVAAGLMSFPRCDIIPIMDDDQIAVRNGEFVVEEAEKQVAEALPRLVDICGAYYAGAHYDRPTMIAAPTVRAAVAIGEALGAAYLPSCVVTGETGAKGRDLAFRRCVEGDRILVQVRVVGEGVDLPLRRLIDCAPTLSPVKFLQLFGRITRPGGESEYVGTNRNLLRFAYLLEGLLPPSVFTDGVAAFGESSRGLVRTLGFEGLGKFAVTEVPLYNGTKAQLVCIDSVTDGVVTQYAAVASPLHPDVVYAKRENLRKADGSVYGRWARIGSIPDIGKGFSSTYKGDLSEKQKAWWSRSARWYGLDGDADVNTRQFAALPVLKDTGMRFR